MGKLRLSIVTAERTLLAEEGVDFISAPGTKGRLGILPQHTPLLTTLEPGELRYRRNGEEVHVAISGGFLQVAEDQVIILADTAERADEIDEARAEAARLKAEELLRKKESLTQDDLRRAESSLRKAIVRLRVVRYRRPRRVPTLPRLEEGEGPESGA